MSYVLIFNFNKKIRFRISGSLSLRYFVYFSLAFLFFSNFGNGSVS